MAVIATGWIAYVPRGARLAAIAVLVLGVCANTLGIDFGVGSEAKLALADPLPATEQLPDRVVVFSTNGFLASAPSRDGDVPGLLEALHREGVDTIAWSAEQSASADFSSAGLTPLAQIAGLSPVVTGVPEYARSTSAATLLHEPVSARAQRPCTRLSDGTRRVGRALRRRRCASWRFYCPTRRPQFYGLGALG